MRNNDDLTHLDQPMHLFMASTNNTIISGGGGGGAATADPHRATVGNSSLSRHSKNN